MEEEPAEDEELLEDVERLRKQAYEGGGKANRKGGERSGWQVALASVLACECLRYFPGLS